MPPKPKPRTELARAAAVASKWAFGTPGLSEQQQAAAQKNYEYIQRRLTETGKRPGVGSALSPEEEKIGRRWTAQREKAPISVPKPKYRPGDPEWSSDATWGAAEIKQTAKAFSGPKKGQGDRIFKELERQGFQRPTTEKQADAQVKQLLRKLDSSQRSAVKAAIKNPLDLAGNAELIGPQGARRLHEEAVKNAPPPPPGKGWAGSVASAADWATPDTVQKAAGLVPFSGSGPVKDIKEIVAGVAMAPAAIAETAYHDATHPGDVLQGHTLLGKMGVEMIRGWGDQIQRATPLPADLFGEFLPDLAHGRFGKLGEAAKKDLGVMRKEWQQHPFTSVLNLYPFASGAMRIAELPRLAKRIAEANPGMSRAAVANAARKESYRPGWAEANGIRGGFPTRMLTGKIESDGVVHGTFQAPARGWSRSTLTRKFQGATDKFSRGEGILKPGQIPGTGRLTETRRAATALRRKRTMAWERERVRALRQMDPVEKYIRQSGLAAPLKNKLLGRIEENRARLAETFYGPQGPAGDPAAVLTAVGRDLKDIAHEGGIDIPTNTLGKIDKELARLDRAMQRMGIQVNIGQGLWADAQNVMRDAGYSNPQIAAEMERMASRARVWARRKEGRDPNEWLSSPDGRNVAGFVHGTPDEKIAAAQTLHQRVFPDEPQPERIPDEATLRETAFDGVDMSVFREHNIDDFLKKIPEYLKRGAPYRHWYENSGQEILRFANDDKELAARVAQVVAVMSASRNPRENINLALEAVREYQATGKISVTTAPQNAKAEAIMRGEAWEGRKTNRFYANMLEDIDPVRYQAEFPEGGEVTNDIWMARLFGLKSDVPTPREYEAMAKIQQNIAAATGWKPKQIQAALWVPAKADAGRVITGPGGKKIRAPLSDDEAGIDFARALQEESVTMPIEAAPGRRAPGQPLLRTYDELDWEDKRAYTSEKAEAVRDYLRDAEVFGTVETEGLGIFENATNPNFTVTIPTPVERLPTGRKSPKTGEEIKTPVSWTTATARRHLTRVMSDIGHAFNQDAMTWFRPIYRRDKPTAQNGMLLKLSRPLTDDETFRLYTELKTALKGETPIVPGPDGGLYALNFSPAKNPVFHAEVQRVLEGIHQAGNDLESDPVPFRFDGDYRTRSRYAKETADEVAAAPTAPGRPNVREAARRLRQRSEEIDRRYLGSPEPARAPDTAPVRTLAQASPEGTLRGAVSFLDTPEGKQLVYLAEDADPSTFGHEMFGHAAGEMKREYPQEFAAVEKRYGKDLEDWGRGPGQEHERFATETERYFMSGKAPTKELEPIFAQAKRWMYAVYETIKELGRPINPETKALLDRYFGLEPLDFTPPARLRRTGRNAFPDPADIGAINGFVDETSGLLGRGADALANDPQRVQQIAGNMKWLEQQVLPYVGEMDSAAAQRVHALFNQFDEVKKGRSIFTPDQRQAISLRGKLLDKRARELDKMSTELHSAPDESVMHMAHDTFEALDNAETIDDLANAISDLKDAGYDIGKRTQYNHENDKLLTRQVEDIERALDPNRKVDKGQRDAAVEALRSISEQMTQIYLDTFGEDLAPEEYASLVDSLHRRDNILPTRLREQGLLDEGTGSGVYMPHFSIFDKLSHQLRGAVRLPAAGRDRKNLSMKVRAGRETFAKDPNKLIRYQTGELKVDPRSLLSVYKNRLRFVETSLLRKQLKEISVAIPEDANGNPRIPEGWYLIKTKGAIPERLRAIRDMSEKELDELVASGQDFDSQLATEEGFTKMLDEYKNSFLGKEEGGKIPPGWKQSEVRMLPPEVVETLVGKVFESTPGGFFQSAGGLLSLGGRVATIFAHPLGYTNANVVANAIMLGLTNPTKMPKAFMEFLKTPGSLRREHPALYQDIATDTGDIKAEAGIPNFYVRQQTGLENAERMATGAARSYAGFLGDIADQPFRVASWTGEAKKLGYDTPAKWRELLDAEDGTKLAHDRDNIAQRSRENMLDFNKLSPQEQTMARYLFIWPFVRASAAWPVWMLKEYGGRMAAINQVAGAQTRAYEGTGMESVEQRYNKVAPAGDRSMWDIGDVPFAGGTINTQSVNPVSPLAEKAVDFAKIVNDPKQAGAVVGDMINPALAALGKGAFGGQGMDWEKILGSTLPGASYLQAYLDPSKRGAQKYTDRSSFWDYLRRREGRFWPEEVDHEKIKEAGQKEKEAADTRPTWEKAVDKDNTDIEKVFAASAEHGQPVPTEVQAAVKRSVNAYHALDRVESEYAKELGKPADDLTMIEKIEATERVAREFYPEASKGWIKQRAAIERLPENTRGTSLDQAGYRDMLRERIQAGRSVAMTIGRDKGVLK